ncbi:hypothetical protein HKCCE2091_06365 [Rhodobacterales bacterium HKCCE2091]|nr:hypothetical protein [Rhodobacterales bacterium HKCCE2091]
MSGTAEISVWDASTRAVLVQAVTVSLPAEIGRVGADAQGRITDAHHRHVTFGQGLGTMSRQHMTITPETDGSAIVRDESSNGVARIVPGQPPMPMGRTRHEHMPAGAMRQFETVGLIIEVALPRISRVISPGDGLKAVYESSSGKDKPLDIATACVAVMDEGNGVQMEQIQAAGVREAMARLGDRASRCLAVLGPDGAGHSTVLPGRDDAILCSRRALPGGEPHPLKDLDTVEAGPLRIRITAPKREKFLVCVNPACGQMNEHDPGGNCRYCGTRLGDAITRIQPGTGA